MQHEITVGIASNDNPEGLNLTLSSLINQTITPSRILLRLDGTFKPDFYFNQLLNTAKFLGINVDVIYRRANGVRTAREDLLNNCHSDWLWMLDDDCLVSPDCLEVFLETLKKHRHKLPSSLGYVCGSKGDVANLRGYGNFDLTLKSDPSSDTDAGCFNHFYNSNYRNKYYPTKTLDTGHVFIQMPFVRADNLSFVTHGTYNCGGEDTLFAAQFAEAGYQGFVFTGCRVYHLEKPKVRFNEFAARKAYVREVALTKIGLTQEQWEAIDKEFMPWVK